MQDLDRLILGKHGQRPSLADIAEHRAAAVALARQAQRRLDLFTPDLEPGVYDTPEFCEAVKRLVVRGGRRALVRILVLDSRWARQEGHRLLHLGRRHVSKVRFRTLDEENNPMLAEGGFLLADVRGVLVRLQGNSRGAWASFHAPAQGQRLSRQFENLWMQAVPDPYLRCLFL